MVRPNPLVAIPPSLARHPSASEFALVPYDSASSEWDRLVRSNQAAQLWHRARWIELLKRAYRLEVFLALLRSGPEVISGCIVARSANPFSRRFVALPFSDSGEPLALDECARVDLLETLANDRARAYEIRGVAAPPPWRTVTCFLNWQLDLSASRGRLYQNLAANFRRNVVKASRNSVKIECGNDPDHLRRFRILHEETRHRQGIPSQPARFFQILYELYGSSGDVEVWLASHQGRDVACVLVLRDGAAVYYKWSARADVDTMGAGHLLAWSMIEALAGKAQIFDLGRTDERNDGLNRFKRELGAVSSPLPYSFVPRAPKEISAEIPSGLRRLSAQVWRRLPAPVCRALGNAGYRYLS